MITLRSTSRSDGKFHNSYYVDDIGDIEALTKCALAHGFEVNMWYDECLLVEVSGDEQEEV